MLTVFGEGKLFGERFGSGSSWVLALHGWGRNHEDFTATLGAPTDLDAIALDLPGFGATPAPSEPWGTKDYAVACSAVLEEMAEKIVVVGHSFGAIVALQLACLRADRIAAVVLTGAPLFSLPANKWRIAPAYRLIRTASRLGLVSDRRLEIARDRYGSSDYRNASGVMRAVLVRRLAEQQAGEYETVLSSLRAPLELVWGASDSAAPLNFGERAKAILPSTNLVVLDGIDHFVPTRDPQALRDAILRHKP